MGHTELPLLCTKLLVSPPKKLWFLLLYVWYSVWFGICSTKKKKSERKKRGWWCWVKEMLCVDTSQQIWCVDKTKALHWEQTHPAYLVGITVQSIPSHTHSQTYNDWEDGQSNMIIKAILVTLQIMENIHYYTIQGEFSLYKLQICFLLISK